MKLKIHTGPFMALLAVLLCMAASSCREKLPDESTRHPRRVLILYSGAYNDISGYLREDIQDLCKGYLPKKGKKNDIMLVFSKLPQNKTDKGKYSYTGDSPSLVMLTSDKKGNAVKDTLKIWPAGTIASSAETMREVLSYVKDEFPANSYGLIFSSHASGWLPEGYYQSPSTYENSYSGAEPFRVREFFPPIEQDPSLPAVKSLGKDFIGSSSDFVEMDINDFAEALPMHFEYILLDCCLSGNIEVAYALRNKASYIGFSPTEVLAEGFDYKSLTTRLLKPATPDPELVCRDYFEQYRVPYDKDSDDESERKRYEKAVTEDKYSATITFLDTKGLERVAEVCAGLNSRYREAIAALSGTDIQGYFRLNRHFFYDLMDIYVHAGITEDEKAVLQEALDNCITYKEATAYFFGKSGFKINTYSGLSMYLPSKGSAYLNKFYREEIEWNDAVKLVD